MNRTARTLLFLTAQLISVPSFAADAPKAHVATCADGKEFYTSSIGKDGKPSHAGACAGHGGVAKWTDGSPVKSHAKKTEYK